jgi:hypothetical protein
LKSKKEALILITFCSFHAESSRTLEDTGCLFLCLKTEASTSGDQDRADGSVKQEEEELGILDRLEQVTDALLSR